MTRTTIDLDQGLLEEIKALAARSRESMSRLANRLLRDAVNREKRARTGERPLRWNVVEDGRPAPGFEPADRSYLDLLDEDRP